VSTQELNPIVHEPPRKLPVNLREITRTPSLHRKLEVAIIAALDEPHTFANWEYDPALRLHPTEVRMVQEQMVEHMRKAAKLEYRRLGALIKLLPLWENEQGLSDLITSDRHLRGDLGQQLEKAERYETWAWLCRDIQESTERIGQRYLGYFDNLLADLATQKEDLLKQTAQTVPLEIEYRNKALQYEDIQRLVRGYYEQATRALMSSFGFLICAIAFGGWRWGFLGGVGGLLLGVFVLSNVSYSMNYLRGASMEMLHTFLSERFPPKKYKGFFKYKKKNDAPISYDASLGEALSRLLRKEIAEFRRLETHQIKRREEFAISLQFIDGRREWCEEQRHKLLQTLAVEEAPKPAPPAEKPPEVATPAEALPPDPVASELPETSPKEAPMRKLPRNTLAEKLGLHEQKPEFAAIPSEIPEVPEPVEAPPEVAPTGIKKLRTLQPVKNEEADSESEAPPLKASPWRPLVPTAPKAPVPELPKEPKITRLRGLQPAPAPEAAPEEESAE
jgi:hypothetical protein